MITTQPQATAKAGLVGAVLALMASTVPTAAQDFTAPNAMPALASSAASDDVVAQAAVPIVEFLGGGYMGFSEECAAHGWSGTQQIMVRMQPQGFGGNDADESQLAIYFPTGTIAVKYDITAHATQYSHALTEAVYVWNGPWSPENPRMSISFYTRYGEGFNQGDTSVHRHYISLANFNEIRNCSAVMRVSVGRNG